MGRTTISPGLAQASLVFRSVDATVKGELRSSKIPGDADLWVQGLHVYNACLVSVDSHSGLPAEMLTFHSLSGRAEKHYFSSLIYKTGAKSILLRELL